MRRALALGAVLLALEGMARLAFGSDFVFKRLFSPLDEPSWRLRWLRARKEAPGPTPFSFDRHDARLGWTLAPGLRELELWGGKRLSSNSHGLRGVREPELPKPEGLWRIAVFGDSFTFGEEVSDHETFAHQLEKLLADQGTPVEVLNFGVHGYGHDQMLLRLRQALPVFQPDVVILGYVSDDSLRNLWTFRDYAKPRFRLQDGRLELEGVPVPAPAELAAREARRSRFFDLLTMLSTRMSWRFSDRASEVDRLTDALLSAIAREARAAGVQPAFVLLPAWNELAALEPQPLPAEAFVLELARREQVPCLRLRPLFLERARLGAEFEKVGHWGPREHRLTAEGLADFLRRSRLLPEKPALG